MVQQRKTLQGWNSSKYFQQNGAFHVSCQILILQDHVEEILRKWDAIDDEIWAKVIVLERNRRVAKVGTF